MDLRGNNMVRGKMARLRENKLVSGEFDSFDHHYNRDQTIIVVFFLSFMIPAQL